MPPDGPLPLVGRQEELAVLLDALASAADSRGGAVLVTGEAGTGKSRLMVALRDEAVRRGARVLQGGCFDSAGELIPYGPFLEWLRDLDDDPPADELRPRVQELTSFLLGRHELQADRANAGRYGRASAFELALDLLTRLDADRPVVLVVEDVHWVDQSSLDLLTFLARGVERRRVLIVLTARQDASARSSATRRTLLELVRSDRLRRLALARLPEQAMEELVTQAAAGSLSPDQRSQIVARAEGNAFFALELLGHVRQTGRPGIPDTVRESVLGRLAGLSAAAKRVLHLAAVGRSRLSYDLLERAFGAGHGELDPALRSAVEAGLLRVVDDGDYAFPHALVRDVVHGDMLPGERRRCHEALAQAGQGEQGDALAVTEQAFHWREAGRWPEALRAAVRAGEAAERSSAYPETAEQYGRALALWERVDDPEGWAGCDRVDIEVRAADALRWAGHPDRALALVDARRKALVAGADDRVAARLLERAGRYHWELGDTTAALSAYEQASQHLSGQAPSALRASALAARATGLILLSRFQSALEVCDSALREARLAQAHSVEAHALATAGVALAMTGRVDDGIAALHQGRTMAERSGDVEVLCRAYSNLSWVLEQAGRVPEALAASQDGMRATAERGLLHTAGVPLLNNAASQLVLLGRWEEAEALARDCLGRPGMARFAAFLHLLCAETATGRGDVAEAERDLAQAGAEAGPRTEPPFAGPLLAVQAELALWRDAPELARRHVTEGLALVGDSEHREAVLRLCALGARAVADLTTSRPSLPATERAGSQRLLALVQTSLGTAGPGSGALPQVAAWGATAAAELSRVDGGSDPEAWTAARDRWEELGFPYQHGYACFRLAEALAHRRALTAAAGPLAVAAATAQSLGAAPLGSAVEALRRRAGLRLAGPPPPVPAVEQPPDDFGLTAREMDVLRALVEGRTNRQIARRLFITEKTTEIHVSRILAKLGVRNRLQAAAVAHSRRLVDPPQPLVDTE